MFKSISFLSFLFILLVGCGGGGSKSIDNGGSGPADNGDNTGGAAHGKAQLGVLAGATVKLYKLGDSSQPLFTETTSSGDTINAIGNFNAHENELDVNKYYLYEVTGGKDWDFDDNGDVDAVPTINQGTFRAIVKGADVVSLGGNIQVTAVSEILYKKLKTNISDAAVLEEKLNNIPRAILKEDLNADNVIDKKDILLYDPVKNRSKLTDNYHNILDDVTNDILKDSPIDVRMPPTLGDLPNMSISYFAPEGSDVGVFLLLDDGGEDNTNVSLSGTGADIFNLIDDSGKVLIKTSGSLVDAIGEYTLQVTASNASGTSTSPLVISVISSPINLLVDEGGELTYSVPVSTNSGTVTITDNSNGAFSFVAPDQLTFDAPAYVAGSDNLYTAVLHESNSNRDHTINVTVNNVSDVPPTLPENTIFSLSATKNTDFGPYSAVDSGGVELDEVRYVIVSGGEHFGIKPDALRVRFFSIGTLVEPQYTFVVKATNNVGSTTATIKVNFETIISTSIYEDETLAFVVPLSGPYQALSGDDANKFSLDGSSGVLTFITQPDFEAVEDFNHNNIYEVTVRSNSGSSQSVHVEVRDRVETVPTITGSSYDFTVPVNSPIGTVVGTIESSGARVSHYTLSDDAEGHFEIKEGRIYTSSVPIQLGRVYIFTVTAHNSVGASTPVDVKITVN